MEPLQAKFVGIAYYRLEDYERVRALMLDGHRLPRTFTEWRHKTEQLEKQLRRAGQVAVKAYLDPDIFIAWCAARGLDVDAKARMRFAAEVARDHARESDSGP